MQSVGGRRYESESAGVHEKTGHSDVQTGSGETRQQWPGSGHRQEGILARNPARPSTNAMQCNAINQTHPNPPPSLQRTSRYRRLQMPDRSRPRRCWLSRSRDGSRNHRLEGRERKRARERLDGREGRRNEEDRARSLPVRTDPHAGEGRGPRRRGGGGAFLEATHLVTRPAWGKGIVHHHRDGLGMNAVLRERAGGQGKERKGSDQGISCRPEGGGGERQMEVGMPCSRSTHHIVLLLSV